MELRVPDNVSDLFMFHRVKFKDQKIFQFYSGTAIKILEGLLNVTNRILQDNKNKLSLPQLAYFNFIKMCCEGFIIALKRTENNI